MKIDTHIVDVLLPDLVGHDRHLSAFLVYLFLYRHPNGQPQEWSLREIAEGTGFSRRAVRAATARLEKRRLVAVSRAAITSVGTYEVRVPGRR